MSWKYDGVYVTGSVLRSVNLQSAMIHGWLPAEIGGGGGGVAPAGIDMTPMSTSKASTLHRDRARFNDRLMSSPSRSAANAAFRDKSVLQFAPNCQGAHEGSVSTPVERVTRRSLVPAARTIQ